VVSWESVYVFRFCLFDTKKKVVVLLHVLSIHVVAETKRCAVEPLPIGCNEPRIPKKTTDEIKTIKMILQNRMSGVRRMTRSKHNKFNGVAASLPCFQWPSWILIIVGSAMTMSLILLFFAALYHWVEQLEEQHFNLVMQQTHQDIKNGPRGDGTQRYSQTAYANAKPNQLFGMRLGGRHAGKKVEPVTLPRPNSPRVQYDQSRSIQQQDPETLAAQMNQLRLPYTLKTMEEHSSGSQKEDAAAASSSSKLLLSHEEIQQCPPTPVPGYPQTWNVMDVLTHWNPDDTEIPSDHRIYQGICYLDWIDAEQRDIANTYRTAELPFLIRNHAELTLASLRWSDPNYLSQLLGGSTQVYRNEHSNNNHFPYWKMGFGRGVTTPKGWTPPTENVDLSFTEWYDKALQLEQDHAKGMDTKQVPHWYLRLNGEWKGRNDYLYDELPIFNPTGVGFFMVDPDDQRGINCRLGMNGVIAEAHYDLSRNFILLLHGQKRYILAHPDQCQNLELYPVGHPSARHSSVNWSDPLDWPHRQYFSQAQVNEVILQAGDVLYLPTAWFHFIVSLNLNYQCNARSGITTENARHLKNCGF
jgi:hypothetical protein